MAEQVKWTAMRVDSDNLATKTLNEVRDAFMASVGKAKKEFKLPDHPVAMVAVPAFDQIMFDFDRIFKGDKLPETNQQLGDGLAKAKTDCIGIYKKSMWVGEAVEQMVSATDNAYNAAQEALAKTVVKTGEQRAV